MPGFLFMCRADLEHQNTIENCEEKAIKQAAKARTLKGRRQIFVAKTTLTVSLLLVALFRPGLQELVLENALCI